ncbi:MAG: MiaB/RimO family radical SAM methylthiotransferase [Patescibacteria group bacterium]|nr:MiaB/RimO family radical SAM methylthiotransferase [Patescibacteria group bacterium]
MNNSYYLVTFGCQMNHSDSERISSSLEKKGYKPASKIDEAGLIVVNMCSIRQSAVDRVYGLLFKLKKLKTQNSNVKTILTGCILNKDKNKFLKNFNLVLSVNDFLNTKNYLTIKPKYSNNFSALIPISNGCNNFCSYCVVPFTRGPLVCRDHKEILKEIEEIVKKRFKEIWLLGQNVNDYISPSDTNINFTELLKLVDDLSENIWIRFTSPHPQYFSNELIEVITRGKNITPYLNLPVQSGDDKILKKMKRPYSVSDYKRLVKKIRKKIPSIILSTDVIVGFPGETKQEFQNTAKLFDEMKFDMAYISKYSPRTGTSAEKMQDNVSLKEKDKRRETLTEILKKTALKNNKKYIGKTIEVLATKYKDKILTGKSRDYKTVKFKGSESQIGQLVKVEIINALPWGLDGKSLEKNR